MPCYEQRVVQVELNALDLGILERALTGAGYKLRDVTSLYYGVKHALEVISPTGNQWGVIQTDLNGNRSIKTSVGMEGIVDAIKQQYAFGVVEEVTKYGWDVQIDGNNITLNQGGGESW
jgi:hypothetical protein